MENQEKNEQVAETQEAPKAMTSSTKFQKMVEKIKQGKGGCVLTSKKWASVLVVVLILALLGGSYWYKLAKTQLKPEEAKTKVVDFIKNNLVQPGTEVAVKEIVKEGGLYKVVLNVQKQEITTFVTMDGKKFFPQVVDLDAKKEEAKAPEQKEIPKNDKPVVDLFVMSFCPYGNKAEDTLKSAYDLLKNKVVFNFHYIVSTSGSDIQSLHGPKEVAQNEREACVLRDYGKDKWFGFVSYVNKNCGSDGACWEAGAKSLGINTAKVSACVTKDGLALMQAEEKVSKDAGAEGSPTMLINGVSSQAVYKYGNSEEYKNAICSAFTTAPAECAKTLSADTSAAAAQGGSCGN